MLDRFGFKRKTYAQLQEEMEQRAKDLFGENVNLTPLSPVGFFLRLFAWFLSKTNELAEKVYHSAHVTEAEGVQLDYLTPYYRTSRNPAQSSTVPLVFTGTPGYMILEGTRYETETGIDFAAAENITLDSGGNGTGLFYALTPGGAGNVAANTITVQSEPSADIFTVTNPNAATGGQDRETDDELKNRLLNSGASNGSGTVSAILTDVLAIPGVRAANINVNRSDVVVNGQPPHSNQVYVLGGDGQTIANALFENFTGIQFFGTTPFNVADLSGKVHEIAYTPATVVDIFASVTVTTDNTFETNGADKIKDAIVKVIGGTATDGTQYDGLTMGADVIRFQVERAIGDVQGVVDATVTIGKSSDTLGTANIAIADNEAAQANTANISVVVS